MKLLDSSSELSNETKYKILFIILKNLIECTKLYTYVFHTIHNKVYVSNFLNYSMFKKAYLYSKNILMLKQFKKYWIIFIFQKYTYIKKFYNIYSYLIIYG